MMYRGAIYNENGSIDCEVNHPNWGWIPITLSEGDKDTAELYMTVSAGAVAEYVAPPELTEEEQLENDRRQMRCSPAQFRIALHRASRLAAVELIIATDAEAAIAWEYATVIERISPLIDALTDGGFTATEIDELFIEAMLISI